MEELYEHNSKDHIVWKNIVKHKYLKFKKKKEKKKEKKTKGVHVPAGVTDCNIRTWERQTSRANCQSCRK